MFTDVSSAQYKYHTDPTVHRSVKLLHQLMSVYIGFLTLCILLIAQNVWTDDCIPLGQPCTGSPLKRCCGELRCQKEMFSPGTCETCVGDGYSCAENAHCCSNLCKLFKCEPQHQNVTSPMPTG
ncbi:hypothetical protein AHF37_10970 [Paragonimus kellicotti]|nr:hypothetical protein AHF37_10970 [Paragonimus kellicotti]